MTDVTAEARAQAKQKAAQMAVVDNNFAATCGIIAVVVPAPPAKLAFGVGSGLFWLLANYRQSVANDPPRDDFDQVWQTSATVDDALLPQDQDPTIAKFMAQSLVAADADYALYISLERFDGAVNSGDAAAAEQQAQAVQFNANASADAQETLLSLAQSVNDIAAQAVVDSGRAWDSVTLDEVQAVYTDVCGTDTVDLTGSSGIASVMAAVTGAGGDLLVSPQADGLSHPIIEASELPAEHPIVDDEFTSTSAEYATSLRGLTS